MAREGEGASGRVSWTLETEHEPNCSLPKGFQVLALEQVTSTRGWPESLRLGLSKKAHRFCNTGAEPCCCVRLQLLPWGC